MPNPTGAITKIQLKSKITPNSGAESTPLSAVTLELGEPLFDTNTNKLIIGNDPSGEAKSADQCAIIGNGIEWITSTTINTVDSNDDIPNNLTAGSRFIYKVNTDYVIYEGTSTGNKLVGYLSSDIVYRVIESSYGNDLWGWNGESFYKLFGASQPWIYSAEILSLAAKDFTATDNITITLTKTANENIQKGNIYPIIIPKLATSSPLHYLSNTPALFAATSNRELKFIETISTSISYITLNDYIEASTLIIPKNNQVKFDASNNQFNLVSAKDDNILSALKGKYVSTPVGGFAVNELIEEETLADILMKLLGAQNAIGISAFNVSGTSTDVSLASTTNTNSSTVSFRWSIDKGTATGTEEIVATQNDELLSSSLREAGTYRYIDVESGQLKVPNDVNSISVNFEYTIGEDGGDPHTASTNATVSINRDIYYGISNIPTSPSAYISRSNLQSGKTISYATNSTAGQPVFKYPYYWGSLNSILDENGFENKDSFNIEADDKYYTYKYNNIIKEAAVKFTFKL